MSHSQREVTKQAIQGWVLREVLFDETGEPLAHREPEIKPVAWSIFDKRSRKHWYTHESPETCKYYTNMYSHREPDGSRSMICIPLYSLNIPSEEV